MKVSACRVLAIALRLLLGGFFLAAGWSKLGQTLPTLASIYSYQIVLPDRLAELIARGLPGVELLLAGALFGGVLMPVTLSFTGLILAAFTLLTAQAWWRGLPIDCGCFDFGSLHPTLAFLSTPAGATLRNIVLLFLVALLAYLLRVLALSVSRSGT